MTDSSAKYIVKIARGNIYIPIDTFQTYFERIDAVALLPHPGGILVFPLIHDSAGGLLLKIRNLLGDRVIHAQEFFRNNNYLEEFSERTCRVQWQSDRAALLISCVPPFDPRGSAN